MSRTQVVSLPLQFDFKVFSTLPDTHLSESLSKLTLVLATHGIFKTTHAVAKTLVCSPQTDGKAELLKATQLLEFGGVELVAT